LTAVMARNNWVEPAPAARTIEAGDENQQA